MSDFEVLKIINDVVNEICPNKRKLNIQMNITLKICY
jgi:hypothetical protein